MRKDYPVDPTVILAVMWPMVAGYAAWCWARAAGDAAAGRPPRKRGLDDPPPAVPPPPADPAAPVRPLRFGSDDW